MKKSNLNVLLLGNSASEHALAVKLKKSKLLGNLFCIPGHRSLDKICHCEGIELDDYPNIIKFAQNNKIDLVLPGAQTLVKDSIVNYLRERDIQTISPPDDAVNIATSRTAARELLHNHAVPIAAGHTFDNIDAVYSYIENVRFPLIAKTDSIGRSKTVRCENIEELEEFLNLTMKEKAYGETGARVIIEKLIVGPRVSIPILIEGRNVMILPYCSHLNLHNDNVQAAYTTTTAVDFKMVKNLEKVVVVPLVHALNRYLENYCGIMTVDTVIANNGPCVVDLKMLWEDMPTLLLATGLKQDLLELYRALFQRSLNKIEPQWRHSTTLVLFVKCSRLEGEMISKDISNDKMKCFIGRSGVALVAYGENLQEAIEQVDEALQDSAFLQKRSELYSMSEFIKLAK